MKHPLGIDSIKESLIKIGNQQVLLDSDVARIYGVETRDINKAVSNNPVKFPKGYVISISKNEKLELVENFHRFKNLKHSTVLPKAFPERGLYMLATILKSPQAAQATFVIIETFAKLRELASSISSLPSSENDEQRNSLAKKGGELLSELMLENPYSRESESTIEVNLVVLKLKHSLKKITGKSSGEGPDQTHQFSRPD